MSFIGPRAEPPLVVERLKKEIPYFVLRFAVRPGLTGWAQVQNGFGTSSEDAVEKLKYDLYYMKNMSAVARWVHRAQDAESRPLRPRQLKKILFGLGSCTVGQPLRAGAAGGARRAGAVGWAAAGARAAGRRGAAAPRRRDPARRTRGPRGLPAHGPRRPPGAVDRRVPPPGGVRVLLVASAHLRAKVGVGEAQDGGWERVAREAFRDSFISAAVPGPPGRRGRAEPLSLVSLSSPLPRARRGDLPPGQQRPREAQVAAFLRRKLYGRVPLLMLSLPAAGGEAAILAGGRVVTSGVVLTMVKTDLKFSLERFHSFEPVGAKLFVTRAEGDRVFECNRRPAIEAYREALGLDPAAAAHPARARARSPSSRWRTGAATAATTCWCPRRSEPTAACAFRRRWRSTGCSTR